MSPESSQQSPEHHSANAPPADQRPVLVVGATGTLGSQVVDRLRGRGHRVRALVRPGTAAARFEQLGVEIARGDMMRRESLGQAMIGVRAVVSTAAGFPGAGKNAHAIDTTGNSNLIEAAHAAAVPKFVLTSVLSCDQTPKVAHFWAKKLAEDKLAQLGVPFVSLRPGAYLDNITTMYGNALHSGHITWLGKRHVPLTFVLTDDVATYLAAAVDAETIDGEHIDIGWDRPVSITQAAMLLSDAAHTSVTVRAVPPALTRVMGRILNPFVPTMQDTAAMFQWMDSGKYVADTRRQMQLFGPPPTAEAATRRLVERIAG